MGEEKNGSEDIFEGIVGYKHDGSRSEEASPETDQAPEVPDDEEEVEQQDDAEDLDVEEEDVSSEQTTDADDEETAEDDDEDADEEETGSKKKNKKTTQQRFNEITKARREAERRAEAAEQRAIALEQRMAALEQKGLTKEEPEVKTEKDAAKKAPDPNDYDYGEIDSRYISDLASFKAEEAIASIRRKEEEERQAKAAAEKQQEQRQKQADLYKAGKNKYDDFEEVVIATAQRAEWPLTPTVGQLILSSDVGADIAYYLATHRDQAENLASQSETDQARMFGRLEAQFSSKRDAPKKKAPTKAPAPPTTRVKGIGVKAAPDYSKGDFNEDFYKKVVKELSENG